MYSPCLREANETCCHGCCPTPFLSLPDSQKSTRSVVAAAWCAFTAATASSLYPNIQFTNHESLPSLQEAFSKFSNAYLQYSQTDQADQIRVRDYYHLSLSNNVCLDYIGHGLFSYSQIQSRYTTIPIASTSSATPPLLHFDASELTHFEISHRSANFNFQILQGGQESELESKIQKRIMAFLNISEDDYSMVFTANQSSAFKLLADTYPFQSNRNLLMVYDHESEALNTMTETSKKRGARVMSSEFSWPNLRIQSAKLRKMVVSKRKKRKRGLFVFPLQSRMTGARYSYLWMSLAQENGWHVLLDACALGPKDMDTLGLSLFRPDFLICSFYKVFGENPSGFGCLFVKKSIASVLKDSTTATSIGMVKLVPATRTSKFPEEFANSDAVTEQISEHESEKEDFAEPSSVSHPVSELHEIEEFDVKQKRALSLEIVELDEPIESSKFKTSVNEISEIQCRGLDHADSLGLILISNRARFLINWLVNALMSLQHPSSECRLALVRIYGPKIKFNRGPAVAFNVFDWKGEKIDPALVQKLADRNNISLSCGFLHHILFSDKYDEEKERIIETIPSKVGVTAETRKRETFHSSIPVVTAALGFLTNFDDIYRLWAFLSRFLDADFVEKERWRYMALNQKTVEV